ncbi:MAG TPA: hypothetical protein VGZ25_08715 [Gemmataceae bacterium]|nr:hypothetical protein [Gemmataceae bacterium]
MDARQAARTLEVIRTLMERTCQYQLLTARASLVAGTMAGIGALLFLILDPTNPWQFGMVWGGVFAGALVATFVGTVLRGRESGENVWSRQARTVLQALAPAVIAALALTAFFFSRGDHLTLPGIWMLCYGQGALATASYAPWPIRWLGMSFLALGTITLCLGSGAAVMMMGLAFGIGHIGLGTALLMIERQQTAIRLHRSVA